MQNPAFEFPDYLLAMQETALRDLRHQNTAYRDLKEEESNLLDLTEQILDSLKDADKETVMRCQLIADTLQQQEMDHLYFAGYRDCITLLKKLGVF